MSARASVHTAATQPQPSQASVAPSSTASGRDNLADAQDNTLLYHQTIIPTQVVTHAIEGSFTLPNAHDLVLIRHDVLELWTLHVTSHVLELVHSMPLFAAVYAIVAVPTSKAVMLSREAHGGGAGLASGTASGQSVLDSAASNVRRDSLHYVAITSETGYVTLMRYVLYEPPMPTRMSFPMQDDAANLSSQSSSQQPRNETGGTLDDHTRTTTMLVTTSLRGRFIKINEVCLGRSGARLTVPGARMAVDAGGEALFIAALMRNKAMVPLRRSALMAHSAPVHEAGGRRRGLSWDGIHVDLPARRRRRRRAGRGDGGEAANQCDEAEDDEDDYYYRVMRAGVDEAAEADTASSGGDESDASNSDHDEPYGDDANRNHHRPGRHRGGVETGRMNDWDEDEVRADGGSRVRARHAAEQRYPRGVLLLGSPLEMVRQTVTFSLCALDGLWEHVVFAAIEEDMVEAAASPSSSSTQPTGTSNTNTASATAQDSGAAFIKLTPTSARAKEHTRYLVVYAYVRSLQQVQRTHLIHLPPTAHRVMEVPAAPCGPGGVLVCTDTEVIWYDLSGQSESPSVSGSSATVAGVFKCAVSLPRRVDFTHTGYDPSIIASTVTCVANDFFMLLQDEHGDVFRVMLSTNDVHKAYTALRLQQQQQQQQQQQSADDRSGQAASTETVRRVPNPLRVHYFDTIPTATAMALFRKGFLFVGAEAAPVHGLYKITRNGYLKESEYIVKRVKRARSEISTQHGAEASSAIKQDRTRDDEDSMRAVKKEEKKSSSDAAMPAPAARMRAPPPRPPSTNHTPTAAASPAAVRVIAMYQPHSQLRHMTLIQSYANTPAITALNTSIPGHDEEKGSRAMRREEQRRGDMQDTDEEQQDQQQQQQQPQQLRINALVGRGVDSVLLLARYGYATVREARFTLPTAFQTLIPLVSATALQRLVREQRAAIMAATQSHGQHSASSLTVTRIQALRQLAATVRSDAVWTDKLILCTAQGSTVFHVGSTLVADTVSGFVTTERTVAAATLRDGGGYVQVTTRAIHVLPAASPLTTRALMHAADGQGSARTLSSHSNSNSSSSHANRESQPPLMRSGVHANAGLDGHALTHDPSAPEHSDRERELSETESAVLSVQPTSWTHPHGKPILAAAVTPTLILLSLGSGGGLVSFDYGLAGTTLQQCDVAPTFPPAPAVSLLQPPASTRSRAAHGELSALLFHNSSMGRREEDEGVELAAVATIRQEVFILHPRKLREPLATLTRSTSASRQGGAVTSVLLTYLGGTPSCSSSPSSSNSSSAAQNGSGTSPSHTRRLFCLVGYLDGTLLCCELDHRSFGVRHSAELSCGAGPCLLIAGDHESMCYVHAGQQSWRCEHRDGVMKVVPWRYTVRPTMFARFVAPTAEEQSSHVQSQSQQQSSASSTELSSGMMITLRAQEEQQKRGEMVVAVRERELAVYSSVHNNNNNNHTHTPSSNSGVAEGGGGVGRSSSISLEYSFDYHSLRIAGRRLLRHPTRPEYQVIIGTVHRGHTMAELSPTSSSSSSSTSSASTRSMGRVNHYTSTVQLFHEESNHMFPAYYFPDGEAVLAATMGSFYADFGKEPVLVVASVSRFSHGAGCGTAAHAAQGWLRTFRCTTTHTNTNSTGGSVLQLEPVHNTLLMHTPSAKRADGTGAVSSHAAHEASADYASALHVCEDVGLLFVGMSAREGLCVYSWGQQHLLRKRRLPHVPSRIVAIDTLFAPPPVHASSASSSSSSSSACCYVADLYRCPPHNTDALRRAREQPLLVVCATLAHSVFVARMHPGSSESPSYLLQIARDRVPRRVTAMALLDGNTIAVADRSAMVSFLRLPIYPTRTIHAWTASDVTANSSNAMNGSVTVLQPCIRLGFAQPMDQLYDAELEAAQDYLARQQLLEEVASWHVGATVTSLSVQAHDPSYGHDAHLATRMLVYGTTLGSVGAFIPFVCQGDGVWGWYAQRALAPHMTMALLSQSGRRAYSARGGGAGGGSMGAGGTSDAPSHHVVDGDVFQLWRQSGGTVFTRRSREQIEDELDRLRRVDAARRRVLGLPVRHMPTLEELVAKQRALLTLPQ